MSFCRQEQPRLLLPGESSRRSTAQHSTASTACTSWLDQHNKLRPARLLATNMGDMLESMPPQPALKVYSFFLSFFLPQKPANGWDSKKDNTTTFLTSGRLLGSSNNKAAAGGSGARRLTRRIMGLLQ